MSGGLSNARTSAHVQTTTAEKEKIAIKDDRRYDLCKIQLLINEGIYSSSNIEQYVKPTGAQAKVKIVDEKEKK